MYAHSDVKVGVIGLGYVGLPLALAFSEHFTTIGFDIDSQRVDELNKGFDRTREVEKDVLCNLTDCSFSARTSDLACCNFFIVTVPTPIDGDRQPDLSPLKNASAMIGEVLKNGDTVVYESTVFPGATEEQCVPILEKTSGLKLNEGFYVGYSPERINPGDKERSVKSILKVTSGSTAEVAEYVDSVYRKVITAGTFKASSIKVAEAAKVIENTQRDVNIALINELSMIFDQLGIDTHEVISAAATKWNFVPLMPGLVGGHCISVDPYYLLHKSISAGYVPDIIRKSREINDGMPKYVASRLIKKLINRGLKISNSKCLMLGFSFKPNCPDFRNTKVFDLVKELETYGIDVDVHDPWVDSSKVVDEYNLKLLESYKLEDYDFIVRAVEHDCFTGIDCSKSHFFNIFG